MLRCSAQSIVAKPVFEMLCCATASKLWAMFARTDSTLAMVSGLVLRVRLRLEVLNSFAVLLTEVPPVVEQYFVPWEFSESITGFWLWLCIAVVRFELRSNELALGVGL